MFAANRRSACTAIGLFLCCFLSIVVPLYGDGGNDAPPSPLRILVGSPIRQKPLILKEFLESLSRLGGRSYSLDYYFVDDNLIDESHQLLLQFQKGHGSSCYIEGAQCDAANTGYACNETTHVWSAESIWKVASFKERMIDRAREGRYDYLFLIDSDIVLHPDTIDQLIAARKDIVSNVFWTSWKPEWPPEPQVWICDFATQWSLVEGERIYPEERDKRRGLFFEQLKVPGTYEVGGLGACTLVSREALSRGVSFKQMKNLSFFGEDRHFCVRAVALGLSLYVDTHLPACHIYRESALAGVPHYKWACEHHAALPLVPIPRLTLSMVVKNEANGYLRRVLESARKYISDAVIIDDASTDTTVEVCQEVLRGIPLHLVRNSESKFSNEYLLRKQQWDETVKQNPDWILALDADEIFEKRFEKDVEKLLLDNEVDIYYFPPFDLWSEWYYRSDSLWNAHTRYAPFLVRYKPEITYRWNEAALHCGRFPSTILEFPRQKISGFRLKRYGWSTPELRLDKYHRYMTSDPQGLHGSMAQYKSILEHNPNLVAWSE